MQNINRLKYVTSDNPHNFVRAEKIPVSSRCIKEQERDNVWFDTYGIKYTYNNEKPNTIKIDIKNECPSSIISYINSLPKEIDLVIIKPCFYDNNINCFNSVIETLSKGTNKNIIIDTSNSNFSITNDIYFSLLPINVKVGNFSDDYSQNFHGVNSLDWWSLHANKKNYYNMLIKLIPKTRKRIEILNIIVRDFYMELKDIFPSLDNMNNLEKANLVFEYCSKTIKYDFNSITESSSCTLNTRNDCDYSSNPIETYFSNKEICIDKLRLMKLLLNNKYMKVPCFITTGYKPSGERHEWIEVYDNGKRYYYDLSCNIKGSPVTNNEKIEHNDFNLNGIESINKIEKKSTDCSYQKKKQL